MTTITYCRKQMQQTIQSNQVLVTSLNAHRIDANLSNRKYIPLWFLMTRITQGWDKKGVHSTENLSDEKKDDYWKKMILEVAKS